MAQSTPTARQADALSSSIANDVIDKASEYAGRAGQQIDRAMDSASQTARDVADQTREAGERVQAVAGNLRTAVDKSVRDQPMATLAVAAALGFVVGALWKS